MVERCYVLAVLTLEHEMHAFEHFESILLRNVLI